MSSAAIRLSLVAALSHRAARKVRWLIALHAELPFGSLRAFFFSHVLRPFARVQHTSLSIVLPLFSPLSHLPVQHEEEPSCYFCCMNVSERCCALATGLFIFARVRRHLLYLRGSLPLPLALMPRRGPVCVHVSVSFVYWVKNKPTNLHFLRQSLWQKCVWPGTSAVLLGRFSCWASRHKSTFNSNPSTCTLVRQRTLNAKGKHSRC